MAGRSLTRLLAHRPGAVGTGLDIVCLADMEWDYALWTNRQHVMSRLPGLDSDVRVLYVAPPRFVLSERVRRTQLQPVSLRRTGTALGHGLWRVDERLWVLQPRMPLPNRITLRLARRAYCDWLGRRDAAAAGRLGITNAVAWSYSPLGELVLRQLDRRATVYDVVDDYAALAHYQRLLRGDAERLDHEATIAADLVFVTSARLGRRRRRLNPAASRLATLPTCRSSPARGSPFPDPRISATHRGPSSASTAH